MSRLRHAALRLAPVRSGGVLRRAGCACTSQEGRDAGGRALGARCRGRCEKGFGISYPFTTGTYEVIKAELEQHGVEVSGRPGDPHRIYFYDPDGHRLQRMVHA